jgi:hypothetical protein
MPAEAGKVLLFQCLCYFAGIIGFCSGIDGHLFFFQYFGCTDMMQKMYASHATIVTCPQKKHFA